MLPLIRIKKDDENYTQSHFLMSIKFILHFLFCVIFGQAERKTNLIDIIF